jgi:hypothetical protein
MQGFSDARIAAPRGPNQDFKAGRFIPCLSHSWGVDLKRGGISSSLLPEGTYHVYLMVTAAGDMAVSYVWETYFEITHGQSLNSFFMP